MVNQKTVIVAIVLLLVGLGIGYGVGIAVAPVRTVTTTITATAGVSVGLRGAVPIAALLPLTGTLSSFGEENKVAIELAVSEVNDWLKSIGAPWYLQLVVEDTATDPKTALDKVRMLHGRGIKFFIGPMGSGEIREIKSYVDSNKLLVISQSSTSPALSIPGDFILRYCPDDNVQGPAIARVAFDAGVRYLIPVWLGNAWGDGLKDATVKAFLNLLKKYNEQGAVHEGLRIQEGGKEFSVEVAKLNDYVTEWVSKYGVDKVGVLLITYEEAIPFFTVASKYDILGKVKWFGSDGTAGNALLASTKETAEFANKVKFISTIAAPSETPKFEYVKNHIVKTLGRVPAPYAYNSYDIVWTLAMALAVVNDYNPEKVRDVLPKVVENYYGASGWFKLNEAGDRAFADYELWAIIKEGDKYVWKVVGVWRGATDSIDWKMKFY